MFIYPWHDVKPLKNFTPILYLIDEIVEMSGPGNSNPYITTKQLDTVLLHKLQDLAIYKVCFGACLFYNWFTYINPFSKSGAKTTQTANANNIISR